METIGPRDAVHGVRSSRHTLAWVIIVLLAVNATAMIVRSAPGPLVPPAAFADTPLAGAHGIFAFTGQIDVNRYGLFMMDVETRNVWCYEYLPSTGKVRLVFARSFDYDRYLADFNNHRDTTPDMIRKTLDEQRRIKERNQRTAAPAAADDDEALGTTIPGLPAASEPEPAKPNAKP